MKKQRKQREVLDTGPVEPILRGERVLDLRAAFPRFRNQIECMVDWYYCHHHLNDRQWLAGIRFKETYNTGLGLPSVCARYGGLGRIFSGDLQGWSAHREDCNREITRLIKGRVDQWGVQKIAPVLPRQFATVIENVCGCDQWAGSGNLWKLKHGLNLLADHWRVTT